MIGVFHQCKTENNTRYTLALLVSIISLVGLVYYLAYNSEFFSTEKINFANYKTISWDDLIHPDDSYARKNPPAWLAVINGTFDDPIVNSTNPDMEPVTMDRYEDALASFRVNSELNNQAIRISAYIVPLEFDDNQFVTEFFMVPYYGACLHLPPPPPNQLIHVRYPKGHKFEAKNQELLEANDQAVVVSGILKTLETENQIAPASYVMEVQHLATYTDASITPDSDL